MYLTIGRDKTKVGETVLSGYVSVRGMDVEGENVFLLSLRSYCGHQLIFPQPFLVCRGVRIFTSAAIFP